MGRKGLPTNVKVLMGNRGKRPLKDDVQPDTHIPDPPEHLGKIALAEWDRIAPQLEKLGLISELDRPALAAYCKCYERWVDAETQIESLLVKTTNGNIIQSPLVGIANTALILMHKYLTEFGMTPSARSRVSPSKKRGKGEWDGFGGGK